MGIILTEQQEDALKRTMKWWNRRNSQVWEISGAAGTGKSTIVYYLIQELGLKHDEVLFMAYVGKATLVLARKGNFAQTIHSTIYDFKQVDAGDYNKYDLANNTYIPKKIEFTKKESLPKNIKLLVVDEAAMVSEGIALDILSFGIPVITLGDNNQLDPVFGERYFLKRPDVVLTEPMRQALDSPIVYLSQLAMKGKFIKVGNYGNNCFVIPKDMITDNMLLKSDVVICGRNKTRDMLNHKIRHDILGIDKDYPIKGDKLICRKNNWRESLDDNIFLINGMTGYVENVYLDSYTGHKITIDFRPDFYNDDYFKKLDIDYHHLFANCGTVQNKFSKFNKFEFGYAISVFLSQGSEWDKVFIYDESYGTSDFRKKALYTEITRAKKSLILAI